MGKAKILYIDSEKDYSKKLLSNLIENNFDVKYVKSLKDAFIEYSFVVPHLIIIDSHLSDGNGLEFIKKIKKYNVDVKTIVITNSKEVNQLIEAIDIGIDKLLFKDDGMSLINKTIEAFDIHNSSDKKQIDTLLFNIGEGYYYEQDSHRIIKDSEIIQLTNQENLLTKELVKAQGSIVGFELLQEIIGTTDKVSLDTLRTVVRKIRKKTYTSIIENQSKLGYRINFQVGIDITSKIKIDDNINLNVKVLILKGNKSKNDNLKYQLEKLGFICENAYTIEDAKVAMKIEKYDYLISELNLPDGYGIDFIRDIENGNDIKVIILSSNTDIHYKEYLYFKGILDYIIDVEDTSYLAYNIYKTILKVETNTSFNNILVIEQSKRINEQIKDLLQPRNYNVNIVNNLEQAHEVLKINQFSLVILDINYKNSLDFLVDIKENISKTLPFIVLTDTHRTYEVVRDAFKNGATECLRKPIFAEEFILKVDQIVEHSKLIEELCIQKELLESYKLIVDKSAVISKTDPKGIITYANEMFCDLSGYSENELIGNSHNIIRNSKTPKKQFEDIWNTIKNKKEIWHGILTNKNKAGNDYVVQTSIMPIQDVDGNIIEYIALRNNITDIYKDKTTK